eukprot:Em0007g1504a
MEVAALEVAVMEKAVLIQKQQKVGSLFQMEVSAEKKALKGKKQLKLEVAALEVEEEAVMKKAVEEVVEKAVEEVEEKAMEAVVVAVEAGVAVVAVQEEAEVEEAEVEEAQDEVAADEATFFPKL